jgi:hypothetical protein
VTASTTEDHCVTVVDDRAPHPTRTAPTSALRAVGLRLVLMAAPVGLLVLSMTEHWCH